MYLKRTNKTALGSQRMIAEALFRLMQRKPYQQISIVELCEEAAIGRKTFYRNFETKEDVIDFQLEALCLEFEQETIGKTTDEQLYLYYSFSKRHIDIFQALYKNGLLAAAQSKFARYLPDSMPVWSEDSLEQEYYSRCVTAGIQAILQVWVERSFQEDIEHIVAMAHRSSAALFSGSK